MHFAFLASLSDPSPLRAPIPGSLGFGGAPAANLRHTTQMRIRSRQHSLQQLNLHATQVLCTRVGKLPKHRPHCGRLQVFHLGESREDRDLHREPIGSPRVPSTVGSSLVTPVVRDSAEPDDSTPAARLATPAMPASFADASPPHATPAEVDQSALPPQVPPMPCAAAMTGNAHHPQLHAFAADRVLPALPCFSASAAATAPASRLRPP